MHKTSNVQRGLARVRDIVRIDTARAMPFHGR